MMVWFQVCVVVMLVIRHGDRVLLAKRENTGFKDGYFALPGGKHDGHEPITFAAIREAQEELGIVCAAADLRFSTLVHVKGVGTPTELMYITFEIMNFEGQIINNEPHKCAELKFFPVNELPDKMTEVSRRCVLNTLNGVSFDEMGWQREVDAP